MSDGNDPENQDPLPQDEEINNYDQDEDFPEYANDQNKTLNQIIQEKVQLIHQTQIEIEEH